MTGKNEALVNAVHLANAISAERLGMKKVNDEWDFDYELAKALLQSDRVRQIFRTLS